MKTYHFDLIYISLTVSFIMILLEKWRFFDFWEDLFFQKQFGLIKINYTQICYFCFSFWISLIVTFLYVFYYKIYNLDILLTNVIGATVISRYLIVQILRK